MTLNKPFLSVMGFLLFIGLGCSKHAETASGGKVIGSCTNTAFTGTSLPTVGSHSTGNNIMSVTVNGSQCGPDAYVNEPCVTVTICSDTDASNCQTIDNILLDTGSYGLRIFSSVITVPLTPITNGNSELGECVQYGDGSSQWGPVKYAYVKLGNEPKVGIPILVVDQNFQIPPTPCTTDPDLNPAQAGFNGILGTGLFAEDCGSWCSLNFSNNMYFTCENNNCSCGAKADALAQVTNPVAKLPVDNNGVILKLPSVAAAGVMDLTGSLYIGVDTQANNSSSGTTAFLTANGFAQIKSKFSAFSSANLGSFIDSGSSVLFIPSIAALPDCGIQGGIDFSGFFCPSSTQALSAINYNSAGNAGTASTVNFSIAHAYNLYQTGNNVFSNIGVTSGNDNDALMDWGIPFFYGRDVVVGLEGTTSNLGTGPYWAY